MNRAYGILEKQKGLILTVYAKYKIFLKNLWGTTTLQQISAAFFVKE